MFSYGICNQHDKDIFLRQCEALEKNIQELVKKECLQDVDGSQIQIYDLHGKEILVHNSLFYNEVYVDSDIDLTVFFK